MKTIVKILIAAAIAFGPAWFVINELFYHLAPYIQSLIPNGPYHALLGVIVYIAIALFGGSELIGLSLVLGFALAGLIITV